MHCHVYSYLLCMLIMVDTGRWSTGDRRGCASFTSSSYFTFTLLLLYFLVHTHPQLRPRPGALLSHRSVLPLFFSSVYIVLDPYIH
jgi:hypothetical protein